MQILLSMLQLILKSIVFNAKINASAETHINSPRIKLGTAAAEAVIKGDTFKSIFNSHIHPAPGGPTGPPVQKADPSLSSKKHY